MCSFRNCSSLKEFDISGSDNNIQYLDCSGCTSLVNLKCSGCKLIELYVAHCTSLVRIYCSDNNLEELDVSELPSLSYLSCYNNKLHSLNLSGCRELFDLECQDNILQMLDMSSCDDLTYVQCQNNHIIQKVTIEDRFLVFACDVLYDYWWEWDESQQINIRKYKKNTYGWYWEGEPEKGYHKDLWW